MNRSKCPSAPPDNEPLRGRILVVEDTEDHLTILKLLLQRAGAEVICAEDGHQALPLLEQACSSGPPIDLVVTDIFMPGMNGLVFAETVRARGWNIPLIACSAAVMPEEQAACLLSGCNAFVAKPIRREQLVETCARWLAVAGKPVVGSPGSSSSLE